jgi:glycine oxidase
MLRRTDIVIVGGGVIGLSIAYHLRRAGAEVCVIERQGIEAASGGASQAAAGLLAPLGSIARPGAFADLLLASWTALPELIDELHRLTGVDVEYRRTGALRLAREPKAVARLRRRMEIWQPLGLQMSWLSGDEARQHEPLLSPEVRAAIYAPEEGQLKAPRLVRALAAAVRALGGVLYEHMEIRGFVQRAGEVLAVETGGGPTLACGQLVIAAGAWSARLAPILGTSLPVVPVRGQILALRQPEPPLQRMVFGEAIYLAPRADDTLVVGATREQVGFDASVTAGGLAWLLTSALRLVPTLAEAPMERSWAGLRPGTPDQQPILGPLPGWKNVTLATGHGSVGIMLSAVTGQAIAELLSRGRLPAIISPFGLERFGASAETVPQTEED